MKNRPVSRTRTWHYYSGITLSVFIGIHLANQATALAGAAQHVELMRLLRKVYRHPVVETILLLAVLSQIVTGLGLAFGKKKRTAVERLQTASGLYLAFFLVVHVGAVMYGRSAGIDTDFYFAAAGLADTGMSFFFIPYYFLAVSAVALHIAAVHYLKTGWLKGSYAIGATGVLFASLLVFTLRAAFLNEQEARRQPARSGMPASLSGLRTKNIASIKSSAIPNRITVSAFPVA